MCENEEAQLKLDRHEKLFQTKKKNQFIWSQGNLLLHMCTTENPTFGLRWMHEMASHSFSFFSTTSKSQACHWVVNAS